MAVVETPVNERRFILSTMAKKGGRHGVGVILKGYYIGRVLEMKRVSD